MPPPIHYTAGEPQTLAEIRDWRSGIIDALIDQRASALHAIQSGLTISSKLLIGMTEKEVDEHHDIQRYELDRLTILNLVASAEAAIKVDFFRRVHEGLKDKLSRLYRRWYKSLSSKKKKQPDFDEGGILTILKDSRLVDSHIVGRYRECLPARHWVGHGRYWSKPVAVDQLDFDDVYDRADALLSAMPP